MAPLRLIPPLRHMGALACAIVVGGCQTANPGPISMPAASDQSRTGPRWRSILQPEDVSRLERLSDAWTQALAMVRGSRFSRSITAEGALLQPNSPLPRAQLPPGSYRCRTVTIRRDSRSSYATEEAQFCHVGLQGELLSFTKQTGSRRPGGYLYDDGPARLIFIGATARGRTAIPPYGAMPEENTVGVVERVGPFRYRLVVPWPRDGAIIQVIELTPAATQAP
jgi:hypothetical protein